MSIREKLLGRIEPGWGKWISCQSGWDYILQEIEEQLEYLDPDYKIHQVKEKFGTLRFYYAIRGDEVVHKIARNIVRQAEYESEYTCETCGASSRRYIPNEVPSDSSVKLRTNGWYKTLCNKCAISSGYKIKDD